MQASKPSTNGGRQWATRFGFWLGLVLFVVLLIVPPPASMHAAARTKFAEQLPAETAAILKAREIEQADPDSADPIEVARLRFQL